MKKIFIPVLCFVFISMNAQTADEIIQKYTNTMGGLSAINSIKTAKMTGTMTIQGTEMPMTNQIIK